MQSVPASHRAVVRVLCVQALAVPKINRQTKSNMLVYVGANVGHIDAWRFPCLKPKASSGSRMTLCQDLWEWVGSSVAHHILVSKLQDDSKISTSPWWRLWLVSAAAVEKTEDWINKVFVVTWKQVQPLCAVVFWCFMFHLLLPRCADLHYLFKLTPPPAMTFSNTCT